MAENYLSYDDLLAVIPDQQAEGISPQALRDLVRSVHPDKSWGGAPKIAETGFYVDGTHGDNTADGLTIETAVQTLRQAESLLTTGTPTVFIRGGIYTDTATLVFDGQAGYTKVTLKAYDNELPDLRFVCNMDADTFSLSSADAEGILFTTGLTHFTASGTVTRCRGTFTATDASVDYYDCSDGRFSCDETACRYFHCTASTGAGFGFTETTDPGCTFRHCVANSTDGFSVGAGAILDGCYSTGRLLGNSGTVTARDSHFGAIDMGALTGNAFYNVSTLTLTTALDDDDIQVNCSWGLPVKTSTGNPAITINGYEYINTFDNAIRKYAEGAYRDLATW